MRIAVLILSLGFFIVACKQEKKENEGPSQMEEVMAIHDEVMPKMGHIGELIATLRPKIDTTATGKAYEKAMIDLQKANKTMMTWMKGFGDRFDSSEILEEKELSPEKQVRLNEEEVKVKALRDQINTSITNAEQLLGAE
ncbi:MAG: hypothetical protein AAGF77_13470 [Bacteroidota bacterium]